MRALHRARSALPLLLMLVSAATAVAASPSLVRPDGRRVDLAALADGKPVAVIVTKGDWCPACRAQMRSLARRALEVAGTGGRVVALSAGGIERNTELARELELPFEILHDPSGKLLDDLGLWLPDAGHPIPGLVFLDACGDVDVVRPGRTPGVLQDGLILTKLRELAKQASPCRGLRV